MEDATPSRRDGKVSHRWIRLGAYETKATEAFYYITPPEKEMGMQSIRRNILRPLVSNKSVMEFDYGFMKSTPGHFYAICLCETNTPRRRAKPGPAPNTNAERKLGAITRRQMMLDGRFSGNGRSEKSVCGRKPRRGVLLRVRFAAMYRQESRLHYPLE